jgi:hypothetical protein
MSEPLYILFNKTTGYVDNSKPITIEEISAIVSRLSGAFTWTVIPFIQMDLQEIRNSISMED